MMTTHDGDDSLDDNQNDDDIDNDDDSHDDDDKYLRRQRRVRLLTSGGHRLPTLKTGSEIIRILRILLYNIILGATASQPSWLALKYSTFFTIDPWELFWCFWISCRWAQLGVNTLITLTEMLWLLETLDLK